MMAGAIDTRAPLRPVPGQVVPASIWDLLVWAFRRECARLDFDAVEYRAHVGVEWVVIQQARLGCKVDGGGRSDPHPDADVIAAAVAALPVAYGGAPMACALRDMAREDRMPDPMVDAVPVASPSELRSNQYGRVAATKDAAELDELGWPPTVRRNRRGNLVSEAVLFTPISWWPTPGHIDSARREWLRFHAALRELRDNLRIGVALSSFSITDHLPPQMPWKTDAYEAC